MAEVTNVRPSDAARAISTLVLAFAADPHLRWVYPEAEQYLTHFPDVLQTFAGAAFAGDTVWKTGDMASVALWLPPGVKPDGDATIAKFQASTAPAKLDDLMAIFAQMDQAHPTTPHWYLAWIGVDPAHQGHGMGYDLMNRCLQIVDGDHLPAYLDTPNPGTIPFYERHGFAVTGEWVAGACPPVVSMLRPTR
jgi:GNAT superfamily N-acetyltransferase